MITVRTIIFAIFILFSNLTFGYEDVFNDDIPITTDRRIQTYIYSPNEIYLLVVNIGYQSIIEFSKDEKIENLIVGDFHAWRLEPLNNRLIVIPEEINLKTNMTVITNVRTYQFDIISKELEEGEEKDSIYAIKFSYPKTRYSPKRRNG